MGAISNNYPVRELGATDRLAVASAVSKVVGIYHLADKFDFYSIQMIVSMLPGTGSRMVSDVERRALLKRVELLVAEYAPDNIEACNLFRKREFSVTSNGKIF